MKLKHLDESNEGRRRLSGRTERRGSHMGMPTWGAFLFGGVFVAAGTAVFLAGIGVIPVKSSDVHAPFWILSVFGCVFGIAGLLVWAMGFKQFCCRRRRMQAASSHPGEPAYGDYEWDPRGFQCSRWSKAAYAIGGSAFLTMFLSIFNFWAFRTDSPWMVKGIVGLFDLILILAWWESFVRLGRAMKFGGSKIIFKEFPIRMAGHLILTWQPAKGIVQTSKGSFTLRCVEEWFESTGSGKHQNIRMVHEEVWRQTWLLDENRLFRSGEEIALEFDPPAGLPSTQLSTERPIFWELEIKLDLPGLDFEETYLVPIY